MSQSVSDFKASRLPVIPCDILSQLRVTWMNFLISPAFASDRIAITFAAAASCSAMHLTESSTLLSLLTTTSTNVTGILPHLDAWWVSVSIPASVRASTTLPHCCNNLSRNVDGGSA